jgi:hypothetical protein
MIRFDELEPTSLKTTAATPVGDAGVLLHAKRLFILNVLCSECNCGQTLPNYPLLQGENAAVSVIGSGVARSCLLKYESLCCCKEVTGLRD